MTNANAESAEVRRLDFVRACAELRAQGSLPGLVPLRHLEEREAEAGGLQLGDAPLSAGSAAAFHGGLPRGAVTECVAPRPGDGGHSFLRLVVAATRRERGLCAFIDGEDQLDPESLPPVLREGLIWVRCRDLHQTLQAADLLVRDNNFLTVLVDLPRSDRRALRRIPAHVWYRLQRAVAANDTWLVVCSAQPLVAGVRRRLSLRARRTLADLDQPWTRALGAVEARLERGNVHPAARSAVS